MAYIYTHTHTHTHKRCKDRFGELSRSARAMYRSWCIALTSACAELKTCAAKQKRRRKSRGNR
jgi:hypothetical protein